MRARDVEGLDPNLVTIGIFLAGVFLARMDRGGDQHTKSVQVDTELRQRVRALEDKMSEQSGVTKSVTRLETLMATQTSTMQAFQRDLHDLRMWVMGFPPSRPQRSPFDFPGARQWVEEDQARP